MWCRLSATDSSVLCLTQGGESFEDIFPKLKEIQKKSMKTLNLVEK
jgi:hypothetical protein